MALIVNTKKDLAAYVKTSPFVLECRESFEGDDEFDEVEAELVKLLATGDGSPDFGDDWQVWLDENVDDLLQDAISIVA